MRLIDADALIKDVLDLQNCYNGFSDTYDKACIIGVIDEQPTIDPVKHGRWVKLNLWTKPVCTVCGEPCLGLHGFSFETTDYCPNCGARMEGEEDE